MFRSFQIMGGVLLVVVRGLGVTLYRAINGYMVRSKGKAASCFQIVAASFARSAAIVFAVWCAVMFARSVGC